jgi:GT2 family glycosyltransferase
MSLKPIASIVVLAFNNVDYSRMCIESIIHKTNHPEYELILVDNASQDETPQYFKELANSNSNILAIMNDTNEGFARGNNIGASRASGEYLVFLNNDTVVTKGWLQKLVDYLQDPKVGLVGPVTNSSGNETRIKVNYEDLEGMDEFAYQYTKSRQGETFELDMLPFLCVALRREVYEEIGPLDEQFGVGMFEDDDYALRVKQHAYKIICAEDVFVHHWGQASFSLLGHVRYRNLFEENRNKFESKWGIEWQPHLYRRELIREQIKEMVDGVAWLTTQIEQLQARVIDQENTLNDIYSSNAWELIQQLWKIRVDIAPAGSLRERLLFSIWRPLSYVSRFFVQNPFQMSWYAFAFDRFKRARHSTASYQLSPIKCPTDKELVSIVLPVYNGEDYLQESIDSVLQQTYPHFELIIVDDGSSDKTPEIVEENKTRDARIQLIQQENQRLPCALSNGFRMARGKYLTWISADNRMKPGFLELMVDCLQRHSNWDMIYANQDIIDEHGQPMLYSHWFKGYQRPPGSEHIYLPEDPTVLNTYANNYVGGAFLYRDRVDYLIGGYSPYRFGTEDYDYWMRVNEALQLRHTDFRETVYEYRFHPTSLTSQDEELGITRNRIKLMIFDEFRRDFFLSPLAWLIEDSGEDNARRLAQEIRQWALDANHIILNDAQYYPDQTSRLWFPSVCVMVVDKANQFNQVPAHWSLVAMKILVVTGDDLLPDEVHPGWHLCLATQSHIDLPRLDERRGWMAIPEVDELCTASDIRARSTHLAAIEAEIENPSPDSLKISVVICTYHRGDLLSRSILGVARQTFPAEDYELIIINNDPSDHSVELMINQMQSTEFKDHQEQLRLFHSPFKGLSFARNAGISEARGEVICFLDDDAVPQTDWLEQVWQAFENNPQAGVVGGKILLEYPQEAETWMESGWGKFWSEFNPQVDEIKKATQWWEFPFGANWSARKKAILQIGGFRTNYGRKGSDFGGGEEMVAAVLIQSLGYEVLIDPLAVVIHYPEADRFTFKHVRKTIIAGTYTQYRMQLDLYLPMGLRLYRLVFQVLVSVGKTIIERGKYNKIEHLLRTWAWIRVIGLYLQDNIARFRKPFAYKAG